ncbi:hypothetical protein NDU88_004110 [Pleurodeles waltl]|uniref:Uncharacterized protein n=1 Tax=Pleurodeles waltl TaxID=8319 RepID=A0AAV7WT62_PLEWA|nr:hypothetical protein NDU88_004407 [Pleurodeles waltl]KAJ1216509.1 hypothetical protein NDU88_004110 [Pleurodeles waltl]
MDGQGSKNDCSQYGGDQEDREDEEFRRPDASAEGCLMKSPLKTREGPEDSNLMAQGPPAQSEEGRLTQVSPENSRNDAVPRRVEEECYVWDSPSRPGWQGCPLAYVRVQYNSLYPPVIQGTFGLVPEAGKGNKRAVLEGLLQSRAGRDTEYAVHDLRPLLALLISATFVVSYL